MLRRTIPLGVALPLLLVGCAMSITAGEAAAEWRDSPDLFYNYYAQPGYNGLGAELYPCPRPTPPLVGHTYVPYQPLMPHEFLHTHHRRYVRYHADGSRTRTHVAWGNNLINPNWFTRGPRPQPMKVSGMYWERFSPWKLR